MTTGCHEVLPAFGERVASAAPVDGAAARTTASPPVVCLVGRPNVGKSTFLARATASYVERSNVPGTTVSVERRALVGPGSQRAGLRGALGHLARRAPTTETAAWLVDLPGTAAMADRPTGGPRFWEMLLAEEPDALLVVVDQTDLARHLPMVLACRDLGLPVVVAANFGDEAEDRGIAVDLGRLSQLLAIPVYRTVVRRGIGVEAAEAEVLRRAMRRRAVMAGTASSTATLPASLYPMAMEARLGMEAGLIRAGAPARALGAAALDLDGLGELAARRLISYRGAASLRLADELEPLRWQAAAKMTAQVERMRGAAGAGVMGDTETRTGESRRDRLSRLAISPWPGLPLFAAVTLATLLLMMIVGGWMSGILAQAWAATVTPVLSSAAASILPGPVGAALLWGFDGGILGLLSIGIPYVLTFYILLAVLEDSGYLTSAAVLADRLFNTMGLSGRAAIPLLAAAGCNVPAIYGTRVLRTSRERLLCAFLVTLTPCSARSAVVIAATAVVGGPLLALAAFGMVAATTIGAGLMVNRLVPGRQPALVLELAPLRWPLVRDVWAKAWFRFRAFLRTAVPVMVIASVGLGAVYESGLIWPMAKVVEPISLGLLGLPAVAGIALVFAFLRKELALQLLVVLAVVQYGPIGANLGSIMNPGQLFVYAIVTAVSVPCVATLAALAGEFGWRRALTICGSTIVLALAVGGVLARIVGIA